MTGCAGSQAVAPFTEQVAEGRAVGKHDVSVRRLHIGQLVISVGSFQVRRRPVTDVRFAFEALQHEHDAKRCLRPALYSSLRSSPSHPAGVSALRVTIAIANARKQRGLRKPTVKSRRLFRNESAASRRVRAGAISGSTAMTRTAYCRKSPRVPRVCLGSWALGISDRENTTARRRDKRGSPVEPQATAVAWVLPCWSVGARAAPCILTNAIKGVFGTVCAFDGLEAHP